MAKYKVEFFFFFSFPNVCKWAVFWQWVSSPQRGAAWTRELLHGGGIGSSWVQSGLVRASGWQQRRPGSPRLSDSSPYALWLCTGCSTDAASTPVWVFVCFFSNRGFFPLFSCFCLFFFFTRKQIFMSVKLRFFKKLVQVYTGNKRFSFRGGLSLFCLTTLFVCRVAFRPSIFFILQSEWRNAGVGPSCLTTWMSLRFITGATHTKKKYNNFQRGQTPTLSCEFQLSARRCLLSQWTLCLFTLSETRAYKYHISGAPILRVTMATVNR